jgi:D-alanyl-D-alanine carboxypeptidase (penicillin-binding protein 5/6)
MSIQWGRVSALLFRAGVIAATALVHCHAFARDALAPPPVTASSVYVVDAETGQPRYRKNEDKIFRILSITKLVTAYVLAQRMNGQLSDTVTITQADLTSGATAGLRKGDVWTLQDLLYGMLLVSGNDAAIAIANYVGRAMLSQEKKKGSPIKRFVQDMQSTAAALDASHTRFADPYGLSPSNVSTARDVALIGSTVFRDPRLLRFWRCARRTLAIGGPNARSVSLVSTIEVIGQDNIVGAKTGSHFGQNIYHLALGWRAPNGQTIVAVVLGSASDRSRYDDVRAILAALPRDFPDLAGPATAAAPAQSGPRACQ